MPSILQQRAVWRRGGFQDPPPQGPPLLPKEDSGRGAARASSETRSCQSPSSRSAFLNNSQSRLALLGDNFHVRMLAGTLPATEQREQIITISKSNSLAISSCALCIYIQIEWVYVFNMYALTLSPQLKCVLQKEAVDGNGIATR